MDSLVAVGVRLGNVKNFEGKPPIVVKLAPSDYDLCECSGRFFGGFQIPSETELGTAKVRLSYPAGKEGNVEPAEVELPVVTEKQRKATAKKPN